MQMKIDFENRTIEVFDRFLLKLIKRKREKENQKKRKKERIVDERKNRKKIFIIINSIKFTPTRFSLQHKRDIKVLLIYSLFLLIKAPRSEDKRS